MVSESTVKDDEVVAPVVASTSVVEIEFTDDEVVVVELIEDVVLSTTSEMSHELSTDSVLPTVTGVATKTGLGAVVRTEAPSNVFTVTGGVYDASKRVSVRVVLTVSINAIVLQTGHL